MADTHIEWTDRVWNPTTGCDKVSPGCDHCYALTMAKRLKGMGSAKYQNDGDPRTSGPGFLAVEHESDLDAPLRWRKPAKVFVNSMSDLFHERISDEFIARVFAVMAVTLRHTYQVLTKRHGRMRALLSNDEFRLLTKAVHSEMQLSGVVSYRPLVINIWPPPNVWLGVSVEDQKWADIRIPALLDTPAAVRFLSCEPLLGPVDLSYWLGSERTCSGVVMPDGGVARAHTFDCCTPCPIDWVIVGGESGPGARPMHPDWARSLRDQCVAARVPFHFKQWGEWRPEPLYYTDRRYHVVQLDGRDRGRPWPGWKLDQPAAVVMERAGKKAAGRELDGRTWDEFPAGETPGPPGSVEVPGV